MNKLWLRKMLWSYIPLFLIVFSFLLFFFLQAIVEQNRKNARESSMVFTSQLMQSVEVSLKTVDHLVIRELLNNKLLASYFEDGDSKDVFLKFEVLNRINELIQEVPIIDSFYLYRYSDNTVLSGNKLMNINTFEDKAFAESMTHLPKGPYWTDTRDYREFPFQGMKQVVSVVHEYPVNSGTQGIFVMNIDIASFRSTVSSLYDDFSTFVNIFDSEGLPIYLDNSQPDRNVMSSLTSVYTGWTIESGMNSAFLGNLASAFTSVWFAVGVLVFVSGLIWIIYITRVNYRPIEELMIKLNHSLFDEESPPGSLAADEFAFIETAINNFAAQSKLAEKEFSVAAVLKRKNAFNVMINGNFEQEEMASEKFPFEGLQLPEFLDLRVIEIEIDNPEQTFFTYSGRDRSLFKFVVGSVANEMIQQQDMSVWLEWTSPVHLTGIIFQKEQRELTTEFESMVQWIAKNLKFTVTIAVSRASPDLQNVCLSYEEACTLLHFKAVLGNNRIIRYSDVEHQRQKFEHEYLRTIHEISSAFRSGDEAWKSHYDRFFEDLREDKSSKTEIIKLINYMLADLELHLSSGSKEEIQIVRQAVREVHHHLDTFDMLEELSGEIYDELIHCSQQLQDIRSSRNNYHLLQEVKEYIEQEYANPDLSLDYLSDKFSINAKYLSRLFKESFCENFLDFLMCVRISVAKDLLANHAITIQEVGEKVGYPNAATFRRVFRKIEGISPQDYRSRGGL